MHQILSILILSFLLSLPRILRNTLRSNFSLKSLLLAIFKFIYWSIKTLLRTINNKINNFILCVFLAFYFGSFPCLSVTNLSSLLHSTKMELRKGPLSLRIAYDIFPEKHQQRGLFFWGDAKGHRWAFCRGLVYASPGRGWDTFEAVKSDRTQWQQKGPWSAGWHKAERLRGEKPQDTSCREVVPARGRAPLPLNPRSTDAPGEAAGSWGSASRPTEHSPWRGWGRQPALRGTLERGAGRARLWEAASSGARGPCAQETLSPLFLLTSALGK